ncbi:MAG: aspartate/glutamate racemase family protein [Acidimicrobiales bacterium]
MFDSGFGGLTVARAVIDLLPNEHTVYFGDTARYPYGPRSADEVVEFSRQITQWLVRHHDPKMIVVACNTASAVALDVLQDMVDVPVIGVLEPGLRSLLEVTVTGRRHDRYRRHSGQRRINGWPRSWRPASPCRARPAPASSSSSSGARSTPSRCTCSPNGCWRRSRRQGRQPAARLHPLPVPGPHDRHGHGS